MYGCYNRPPFKQSYEVQAGWVGQRTARMIEITYQMSNECQYTLTTPDPNCEGCIHAKRVEMDDLHVCGTRVGRSTLQEPHAQALPVQAVRED